ncbi:MAG: M55 family metallopeptidase [Armatimonadia bacterium]
MNVYICTDFEGITGVTLWEQVHPKHGAAYEDAQRLFMSDINAAIEGCFEGGATRVVVLDGHGWPMNVVPELMHPKGEFITGSGVPRGWCLDEGFDVGMQVGCHAMNRTSDGVLYHTQNHLNDSRYWYNDRECGEIAQMALCMGHFGIPQVMVTGDVAACREAREFFGPDLVTVAVKEGYGRNCCKMLGPEETAKMIREGARKAMGLAGKAKPFTMELPLRAKLERLAEPVEDYTPLEQIVTLPHVTHEGTCPTQLDVYGF